MKTELKKFLKSNLRVGSTLVLPDKKVGKLGGFTTLGYIHMMHFPWEAKPTFFVCRELKHPLRSFQWHVAFKNDLGKMSADQKIHEFKTLDAAVNKIISWKK